MKVKLIVSVEWRTILKVGVTRRGMEKVSVPFRRLAKSECDIPAIDSEQPFSNSRVSRQIRQDADPFSLTQLEHATIAFGSS